MNKEKKIQIVGFAVAAILVSLYFLTSALTESPQICEIKTNQTFTEVVEIVSTEFPEFQTNKLNNKIILKYKPLGQFDPIHQSWIDSEYQIEFKESKVVAINWFDKDNKPIKQNIKSLEILCK